MVFVLSLHAQVVYAVFSMREFSAPLLPPAATGAAPCHDHDQVHSALPLQVLIRVQATGYSYQSRRDSGLWAFSQVKPLQLLTQLDSSSPHDTLDAHYKVNPVPDPVLPLESSRPPGNSRPPSPSRSPSPRPKPQPWTPSSSSPAARQQQEQRGIQPCLSLLHHPLPPYAHLDGLLQVSFCPLFGIPHAIYSFCHAKYPD